MGPDAMMEMLVDLARDIISRSDREIDPTPEEALRLAELVTDLDRWVRRGGHLPARWKWKRKTSRPATEETDPC